jgi:hypothetical protein
MKIKMPGPFTLSTTGAMHALPIYESSVNEENFSLIFS